MTTDRLLSDTDSESALSIAFVHAIAAYAGYTCGEPPGPDRDSIDIQVAAGGAMRPKIDIQLKATTRFRKSGNSFNFAIKTKNYNDLRVDTQTPRILVVLDLPSEKADWIDVEDDQLTIRRFAYWVSLANFPESLNESSVTISIPIGNRFDVESLKSLMEQSRTGRVGA